MSEQVTWPTDIEREAGREALLAELYTRADLDPKIDVYMKAFAQAATLSYYADLDFRGVIDDFLSFRHIKHSPADQGIAPPTAVNILEAIAKTNMLLDNGGELPPDLHLASEWIQPLDDVAQHLQGSTNDPERENILNFLISSANLSTTTDRRATPYELYLQLKYGHQSNRQDGIRMLDVGSSVLVVANQLAGKHIIPMRPSAIVAPVWPLEANEWFIKPARAATRKAAELLLRPSVLRNETAAVVGMDVITLDDFVTNVYTRGSLRAHGELDDPLFMQRFDRLATMRLDQVGYVEAEFGKADEFAQACHAKYGKQKFNAILLATVTNQFSAQELAAIKPFAEAHGTDDVMVVIQDFMETSASTGELEFTNNWYDPGNYRLVEYNPRDDTLNEVFRCSSSRCQQILPVGSIAVKMGKHEYEMPTSEALMAA